MKRANILAKQAVCKQVLGIQGRRVPGPPVYVASVIYDIDGGVVLTRRVDGFYCWNIKDLKLGARQLKKIPSVSGAPSDG